MFYPIIFTIFFFTIALTAGAQEGGFGHIRQQLKNKYDYIHYYSKNKILKPIIYDAITWRKEVLDLKRKGAPAEMFSSYYNEED